MEYECYGAGYWQEIQVSRCSCELYPVGGAGSWDVDWTYYGCEVGDEYCMAETSFYFDNSFYPHTSCYDVTYGLITSQ
jgi:hypothetical protein